MDDVPGTIYLLHSGRPYKHARHYLGWALDSRLAEHQRGIGARLPQVVRDAGIGWHLVRTWDGDRYRERQLNNQGGRSRMCPACKHPATQEASVDTTTPAGQPERDDGVIRADLTAGLTAARQARSAVRRALASWGMDDPDRDAELLASELAANAAGHAGGPVGLTLRRHAEPDGQSGITCEVTDTSPDPPRHRQAGPDDERGRGMSIVTALADASGVRAAPAGKTTWFTLALRRRIEWASPQPEPEAEAGA